MKHSKIVKFAGREYRIISVEVDEQSSFTIAFDANCDSDNQPANGGARWKTYPNRDAQEQEALMLANRMTLKHEYYSTGFSGGKIVVNSPVQSGEHPDLWKELGNVLNSYDGLMYTGCDLGTNSNNMRLLKNYTPYILDALDAPHVDTSVSTGFGVWTAISKILETTCLSKPMIAVHGLGKVGRQVAQQCLLNGCDVIAYDINTSIEAPCGTRVVSEGTFWSTRSDVLCTASTSGLLTNAHVNKLKTNWIVSAANSPFQDETVETHAIAAGINYLPDFATNAGAVLCDGVERTFPEIYSHMSQFQANEYVAAMIGAKTQEVLRRADILDRKIHEIVRFAHFGNLKQPELQVIAG